MWIFLLPEASKICEGLTAKWPLWDDLIQSPAGFQHFLWSSEAAFYFIVHILFWGTERVTHQTRRQLRNGKSNKDTAQNSLESHFNRITVERCSLYFGDFFFFFSLSDPRFHLSHEPHSAAGLQPGRAVFTWCLSARLDSSRAASWHALCSTLMGTRSWQNKRGDLCETRKGGRG